MKVYWVTVVVNLFLLGLIAFEVVDVGALHAFSIPQALCF